MKRINICTQFGKREDTVMDNIIDVCIIGSGPAAHTAAIYTARAKLSTVIFEGFLANGIAAGGQLTMTTEVENFPGFPEGITGPELCERFRQQSLKMGTRIFDETVMSVDLSTRPFKIATDSTQVLARSIIIATGAKAKLITFNGSETFWNRGISACAVCDGAAPIFRNKDLAVVGGGDSAMEEALYLTKYANIVYLIHRRDQFRASKVMQDRVLNNKNIKVLWNTEIREAHGDRLLDGLTIYNNKENTSNHLEVNGLFYAIGHEPASAFLSGQVETDADGYIITQAGKSITSVPGVFAAGDVQDKRYRQAITAAGSGCIAGLETISYLEAME